MNNEDLIKNIDFENDNSLIDAILNCKSDIYTGKDVEGNEIVIATQNNVGIRVSTYQSNGWIRINNYDLAEDENRQYYIIRSETYEK